MAEERGDDGNGVELKREERGERLDLRPSPQFTTSRNDPKPTVLKKSRFGQWAARDSRFRNCPNRFLASTPSAWGSFPPVISSKPQRSRRMTVGHTHHGPHPDRELTALCRFFATQREPPTHPPGDPRRCVLVDGDQAQHRREPACRRCSRRPQP